MGERRGTQAVWLLLLAACGCTEGSGGAGGSGGRGGTPVCGDIACTQDLSIVPYNPCCAKDAIDADGNTIMACGAVTDSTCVQLGQPGKTDGQCPDKNLTLVAVGNVDFTGCCRPDAQCGVINSLATDFGCVKRDDPSLIMRSVNLEPISCIPGAGVGGGT